MFCSLEGLFSCPNLKLKLNQFVELNMYQVMRFAEYVLTAGKKQCLACF